MSMNHEPLRYAHDEGHTDVCYSEDGKKFITCGSDGDIRIWSTKETEDPVHNCIGEWSLCVRQNGDKLYVATGSNDIQILNLENGDRDGVLDRFTAPINHMAISKNGKIIALAAEEMEVKLINTEGENKEVNSLKDMAGPCLSVALSPDSKYLAASCGDTKLRVWEVESLNLVKEINCCPKVNSFSNAKLLCRMDFEPKSGKILAYPEENSIVLLDTKDFSQLTILSSEEVSAPYSLVQFSPCGNFILATSEEGDFVLFEVNTENVSNISKHPKGIGICGLMWNPLGNGEVVYTDKEGQLGIITDCIATETSGKNEENIADNDGFTDNDVDFGDLQFEDDGDEDNENAVSVEKLKKEVMGNFDTDLDSDRPESSHGPTPRPATPQIPLQQPFMPSSSPEHLDPRYMCWNGVGVIRSYGLDVDDVAATKSIEVEFHDTTFHSSMMMQNYQDYTMGSVSGGALAVANSSQIHVIPLNAATKEWMLKVEEHEEIVLVATSDNLVCFAKNNYIINACSIYGTQRGVVSVPGPLVSMAAFRNLILVAYHLSGVRNEDQCIGIKLIKFEGISVESKDLGSALGPASTLQWLGFSDIGTPAMMDSLGMLSMYPPSCNTWIPYCDTSKHRKALSDGFFVTTVFESYQAVGGIKCKGSMYPGFTPRPTMCELPIEPPFTEMTTDKTQMESQLFVFSTLQVADSERKFKETSLKTFALACKNGLDERAHEFMEILNNPQILALCMKYASKLDKRRLTEKLMTLAQKISNDDEDFSDIQSIATPDISLRPQVNRKLRLSTKVTPKLRPKTKEVSTPTLSDSATTEILTPNNSVNTTAESTINTQDSLFHAEEETKNPFLKSMKKDKKPNTPNPLSLTDKFAGVTYEKENKNKNLEAGEKRKLSDSDSEKPTVSKQRKLDMFKFAKKS